MKTIEETADALHVAVDKACKEIDRLRAVNDRTCEALELAEATIVRLERHAPGSADGTLDVVRAAIRKAKGE